MSKNGLHVLERGLRAKAERAIGSNPLSPGGPTRIPTREGHAAHNTAASTLPEIAVPSSQPASRAPDQSQVFAVAAWGGATEKTIYVECTAAAPYPDWANPSEFQGAQLHFRGYLKGIGTRVDRVKRQRAGGERAKALHILCGCQMAPERNDGAGETGGERAAE